MDGSFPMSAAPAKTADPSMEEILASIRRIIADDDDRTPPPGAKTSEPDAKAEEAAPSVAEPAPEPAAASPLVRAEQDDDEILDLAAFEDRVKSDTSLEIDLPDLSFQAAAVPPEDEINPEPAEAPEPQAAPEPPTLREMSTPIPPPVIEPSPRPSIPSSRSGSQFAPAPNLAKPAPEAPLAKSAAPEPAPRAPEAMLSQESSASVGQAFNLLSHTIMSQNQNTLEDLVREMLKPMLKTWLDDNLPPLVERLVTAEIQRVARGQR